MKYLKRILLVLSLVFIYTMSLMNGESSSNLSNGLLMKIYAIISRIIDFDKEFFFTDFSSIFRECAHFFEFFIFGLLLYWNIKDYKVNNALIICFVVGMIIALSDETLQLFSFERSFQLLDIFIDTCGSIVGAYLFHLIFDNERINA